MYKKGKKYNLKYANTNGEIKETEFTPDSNMSTPQVISKLKEEKEDFFKLMENRSINRKLETKEIKTESEEVKTLYDLIIEREDGIDITDTAYSDCMVYVDFDKASTDEYNKFVMNLCKCLPVVSYDDTIADVNLTEWVETNFNVLDSLFDLNAESKEDEEEQFVCSVIPDLISGYYTEGLYNDLNTKCKFNKLTESLEDTIKNDLGIEDGSNEEQQLWDIMNDIDVEEDDAEITYNIYVVRGGDGVYHSELVTTVEEPEQAEDRVAELQAETGCGAYYVMAINGKELKDESKLSESVKQDLIDANVEDLTTDDGEDYIAFYLGDKELALFDFANTFEGEIPSTRENLAKENNVNVEDIKVKAITKPELFTAVP